MQLKRNLRKHIASYIRNNHIPWIDGLVQAVALLYQWGILAPNADPNAEKVVSPKYQFILVCVPKVATRSILETFVRNPAISWEAHIDERHYARLLQQNQYRNYYKVAFVRNPWDRIVSCYRDKIVAPSTLVKMRYTNRYQGIWPDMPFETFVEWLACTEEGSDSYANRHWISQYKLLEDSHGNVTFDFLVHLENLEFELKSAFHQMGVPQTTLPLKNSSTSSRPQQPAVYNRYTYDLISQRYARDIRLFGYERELSNSQLP